MTTVTLCFLRRDGQVLLIEKRRGLGEGLVIAAGGKVEPGEGIREAAIREVREEVGIRIEPTALERAGRLTFVLDGERHSTCHLFRADHFSGRARESDEATPAWIPLEEIPYDRMWPDDRIWLPHVLEDKTVEGEFRFVGGRPLDAAEFVDYDLTVTA